MTDNANTVLSKAIIHNDIKQFYSIVDHKEWPHNLSWQQYESLIFQSISKGRKLMANILLDRGCPIAKDSYISYNSDMMFQKAVKKFGSCQTWTEVLLKILTRHNIRVSCQNEMGDTMLHIAYLNDAADEIIERFLLKYIGETGKNIVNTNGLSVLHIACTRSEPEVLQEFHKHGITDFSLQIPYDADLVHAGYTPLHFAVENGRIEIVRFLLKHNADIYAQNKDLSTPLHLACKLQNIEMMDLILQADPVTENCVDKSGLSHFMIACAATESVIPKEYLRVAEIRPHTSPESLLTGRVGVVNKCPFAGYSPLHFAVEFGRVETVKLLLEAGADSFALTYERLSPLAIAHQQRHFDVIFLLEQHHDSLS